MWVMPCSKTSPNSDLLPRQNEPGAAQALRGRPARAGRGYGRVTLLLALIAAQLGLGAAEIKRPNFLFIYTDDQRWDAVGVVQRELGDRARFPWFQTPNLDRLAREGVRFRNAFSVMSLCAPSRAAFLTGRYNHFNGIANNHTAFDTNSVTWATQLRAAGYTTAYMGKWHMGSQRGQRPGFDFSASFIGHARYVDPPFEINGVPTETKGWVDDLSTDYALQFIRTNHGRPWALVVGFKSPHGPFEPPARWADKFPDGYLKPTPNLDLTPPFPGPIRRGPAEPAPQSPAGGLKANLNYYRCIAAADENVGRLLKALDDEALADNTLVVYASDNGFYQGEHRLSDKRSAYDESLRIPLLVRFPPSRARGKVLDQLALNIDLAPTLLDFAGVPVPSTVQGRSWRPLLEGRPVEWRSSFFYEYFWEPQRGNPTPSLTAVRTETAKLIRYKDHPEWTELFDLAQDPYETRNLYGDPAAAALRSKLEAEYGRQEKASGYVWPAYADNPSVFEPAQPLNADVLVFRFDHDTDSQAMDSSGRNNHGTLHGTELAPGRDGRQARRFDGRGFIEVPKTASLNPAVQSWTIEVALRAEAPDGIILARGGAAQGYCLYLDAGHPVFAVRVGDGLSKIRSEQVVTGKWVRLRTGFNEKDELTLAVDDQAAIQAPLRERLIRDPNDGMQIGADTGSKVLSQVEPPPFTGLIESVRLYSGERKP